MYSLYIMTFYIVPNELVVGVCLFDKTEFVEIKKRDCEINKLNDVSS